MRRKQPKPDTVVPPEVLEQAKEPFSADHLKKQPVKCSVCGAEALSGSGEPLCWVCRRLKFSAWHEIEQQMPAQE
jgi:hypothetical protein